MTMVSFRLDDDDAAELRLWAERLGIDRSELLRAALRAYLNRVRSEQDAETWARVPLTDDERALGQLADWGVAEDWADWADAAR